MIKSILNLEGVQALSKETQKEVNGGIGFGSCASVCVGYNSNYCGPAHCPAVCTGPGQWVYL